MKEIITLQFGPLANYVGAHLWSMQDEYAANHAVAVGDDDDTGADADEEAELSSEVMLRRARTQDGRREFHVPRLVLVDRQGELGIVGQRGLQFAAPYEALDEVALASAGQTWGGSVSVSEVDIFAPHPFVSQLRMEVVGEEAGGDAWGASYGQGADEHYEEEEEEEEKEEGQEEGDGEDGEEDEEGEQRSRAFAFERTVTHWADYLQVDVHPRSVHELKDYVHGYSHLKRFDEGRALLGSALGGPSAIEAAEALLDRIRRELEDCDSPQGLLVLADTDGAFAGLAHGTLLSVSDELGRITSVCCGLGEPPEDTAESKEAEVDGTDERAAGWRRRKPELSDLAASNRARAVGAFSESASLYLPLCSEASDESGGVHGLPLLRGPLRSRYARAALLGVAVDGLTAPSRALRSAEHRPLSWLPAVSAPMAALRLGALSAKLPVLCWDDTPAGAWRGGAQLCPLLPRAARPAWAPAGGVAPISQLLLARGCEALRPPLAFHAEGGSAASRASSEREWNERRAQEAWWAAPGSQSGRHHCLRLGSPLELPVGFPQFFDQKALDAAAGARDRGGRARCGKQGELLELRTLTGLESSPLFAKGVRDAERVLRAELRATGSRRGSEADEPLAELAEFLSAVAEDYAECAGRNGAAEMLGEEDSD
ncbi:Misato segment II tubulin-like domain-containing protein [Pavlovales sp. CCMP2436]|nr:Misato segment II tubulin-like domain-containing protein [Pavlovales sp. CCMP2436]